MRESRAPGSGGKLELAGAAADYKRHAIPILFEGEASPETRLVR